jgi:SP family sugar:H+ symporter-like MFS transporter
MDEFKKDLGVYDEATGDYAVPSSWLSTGSGTPQAGLALGCLIAGTIGRRVGRVKSFYLAAAISIVGVLIQATTMRSYWQLMTGRIVNSVSMGIICKSVACLAATLALGSIY